MKLLLYCTKAKPMLRVAREDLFEHQDRARCYKQEDIKYFTQYVSEEMYQANGKIVAECDYEIEEIIANDVKIYDEYGIKYTTKNGSSYIDNNFESLLNNSCLNAFELNDYLGGHGGYAIHIKNLHIFDEPKKITAYHCKTNKNDELCLNGGCGYKFFHKAPQNMMKVYDHWGKGNEYVLISIRPEWLCKILNGEKTIEVRKKVLKEMKS